MKAIDFKLIHSSQRKKRLNKNGTGPIWVQAYQRGRHKYYPTEVLVKPSEWDAKRCKVVKHPNAVAYTAKINRRLSELENFQITLINEQFGDHVTLAEFDERLRFTGGQKLTFTAFYAMALEQRNDIVASTKQTQLNTLNHLLTALGDLAFADLKYSTIDAFHQYLLGEELSLTTISKYHRHVKTYINLAINRGLMPSEANPYLSFKYDKGRSKPRGFLRLEELQTLASLQREQMTKSQEQCRDMFMIMAYTGLRFSDAVSLAPGNISNTPKGLHYSSIMKKNERRANKEISLPIYALFHFRGEEESRAQKWIKRCLKRYGKGNDQPLFGGLHNAVVNLELKELAKLAGINKKITTHIGRHSFGTNMAAASVPLPKLQSFMAHAKIETTMLYVHMAGKIKDEVMERIRFGG